MVRTLPIGRFILALGLVVTAVPSAFAQPGSDLPAYLLARAAYEAETSAAAPIGDLDAMDAMGAGARLAGDDVVLANQPQAAGPGKADFRVDVVARPRSGRCCSRYST